MSVQTSGRLTLSVDAGGYVPGPDEDVACVVHLVNDPIRDGGSASAPGLVFGSSSGVLPGPLDAGVRLTEGRAGAGAAVVDAGDGARYLWVAGGDRGDRSSALASLERAEVFPDGSLGPFVAMADLAPPHRQVSLAVARTDFGLLKVGRALYAVGGANAQLAALNSVERAVVLDPAEIVEPVLDATELAAPGTPSLAAGVWRYRSTVVYAADDPIHPCGESLPSTPLLVRAPALAGESYDGIRATLAWQTPDPSLPGTLWSNRRIAGYRIYRAVGGGAEEWYADVPSAGPGADLFVEPADLASTTDLGCGVDPSLLAATTPPAKGELSRWVRLDGDADLGLRQARAGAATLAVEDRFRSDRVFAYAMSGTDASGAGLDDYEVLVLDVTAGTNPTAWETTTWSRQTSILQAAGGSCAGPSPRRGAALFAFDRDNASPDGIATELTTNEKYLFLGPGNAPGRGPVGTFESWSITAGTGVLVGGSDGDAACKDGAALASYGGVGLKGQLFMVGGALGGAPASSVIGAVAWENLGDSLGVGNRSYVDTGVTLEGARARHATVIDGGTLYVVGGVDGTGAPLDSVELGPW